MAQPATRSATAADALGFSEAPRLKLTRTKCILAMPGQVRTPGAQRPTAFDCSTLHPQALLIDYRWPSNVIRRWDVDTIFAAVRSAETNEVGLLLFGPV
jgi:hypothetical protein